MSTPRHLRPEACFVCGGEEHATIGHAYWSNAEADAEVAVHDASATYAYPSGATSTEDEYVQQHRLA